MGHTTRFIRDISPFTHLALFVAGTILGTFIAANPTDPSTIDGNELDTTPSIAMDGPDARKACGGPLIGSGPEVDSSHVVVRTASGYVLRMTVDKAQALNPDDIWVIGVCRKDVEW